MATIQTVGIAITASTSALTRGLAIARSKLGAFSTSVGRMGSSLTSSLGGVATKIASIGMSIAAAGMATVGAGVAWGVKLAAEAEQAKISFEVMLGSAGKANTMIADLKAAAAATPFEFTDLQQGAKSLLAFGIEGNKVLPTLNMLGDISGGNAEKLQSLSVVFGQISSTGRLMGQDLLQLINVGFNPLQEISAKTGRSVMDLKKDMEAGKISFAMVEDAFRSATGEGGRFHGMMEKQSKSMLGMWSTLKDSVATQLTKVGEFVIKAFDFKGAIEGISAFTDSMGATFESWLPFLQQVIHTAKAQFQMLAEIGIYVYDTWKGLLKDWGVDFSTWGGSIMDALAVAEFGFKNWQEIASLVFDTTLFNMGQFVKNVTFFFTDTIPSVLSAFASNWQSIFKAIFDQTASNFWAMIDAIRHGRMPQFDFSPITEGLQQAFRDVQFERELSALDKSTKADLQRRKLQLVVGAGAFAGQRNLERNKGKEVEAKESLEEAAKPATSLLDSLKSQAKGWGEVIGKLKFELPKAQTIGATSAIRKGSAEAFSAIQASNRATKSPEVQAVEELKKIGKGISILTKKGKEGLGDAFKVVDSFLGAS